MKHLFLISSMLMFVTSSSLRNTNSLEKNEKYREHEENECVDVSRFGPVQYEETDFELCDFKKTTHCKKHSKEICHDVQIQKCKLVGYADCKDLEKLETFNDDEMNYHEFFAQDCEKSRIPKTLTEMKKIPVCKNVTKPQCDSKWVLNEFGEKVWAGNENCRMVTWEDCTLELQPITTEVETFDCAPRDLPIVYQTVVQKPVKVNLHNRKCEPVAHPWCEVTTEMQCITVEWEDCVDIALPSCFQSKTKIPFQEYNHLLRCNVKH